MTFRTPCGKEPHAHSVKRQASSVKRQASSVKRNHHNFGLIAAVAFSAVCVGGEYAGVTIGIDGWTIVPIHDTIATTHLIALRDDDELRMTDIDTVLYTRTSAGWDAEAYAPGVSKEDAMIDLANDLQLSDPMLLDWDLGLDAPDVTGVDATRAPFGKGFFVSDPLYAAAEVLENPQPLIEFVESTGGASAGSAINTGGISANPVDPQPWDENCGCALCLQNSIAAGIDAMVGDPTVDVIEAEGIAHTDLNTAIACCRPWTWTNWIGPWSAWECSYGTAWVYTGRLALSINQDYCYFDRSVKRTQQRTRVRRCFNCTQFAVLQSRIEFGIQEDRGGPVQTGSQCTTAPNQPWMPCNSGPNTTRDRYITDWTPALPPC